MKYMRIDEILGHMNNISCPEEHKVRVFKSVQLAEKYVPDFSEYILEYMDKVNEENDEICLATVINIMANAYSTILSKILIDTEMPKDESIKVISLLFDGMFKQCEDTLGKAYDEKSD